MISRTMKQNAEQQKAIFLPPNWLVRVANLDFLSLAKW